MVRVPVRGEVRRREQTPAPRSAAAGRPGLVRRHQERPVRPVLQEAAVEPAFLDHHPRDPEGERPIRARPHPQPLVRLRRHPRAARVDHDEPRPPRLRFVHPLPLREPGAGRVVAPEEHAAGGVEVRGPDPRTEGVAGGVVLVPVADLGAVDVVRAAERAHEPLEPGERVGDGGPARGRDRERHPFRPVLLGDAPQVRGREVQRLVPADPDPAGVGVSLGAGALERVEHPVGAVDEVGGGLPLRAERAPGGMVGAPLDGGQAPVPHHRNAPAARAAEGAPAGDAAFPSLLRSFRPAHCVRLTRRRLPPMVHGPAARRPDDRYPSRTGAACGTRPNRRVPIRLRRNDQREGSPDVRPANEAQAGGGAGVFSSGGRTAPSGRSLSRRGDGGTAQFRVARPRIFRRLHTHEGRAPRRGREAREGGSSTGTGREEKKQWS